MIRNFNLLMLTSHKIMTSCKFSNYEAFTKVLSESKNIVALTGAGVSAESGIPVFRGAGGLWRTHRSADLATPEAFRANPALVWEFYSYRRGVAFRSKPNNAHIALAKFEKLCKENGKKLTVITQNVDGLHIAAGSEDVIELHGALRKVKCTKCRKVEINLDDPICEALRDKTDAGLKEENRVYIDVKDLPRCKSCKGLVRPYIIWFGENLDPDVMHKSRMHVENCDLCLVIGTSSQVYPAAMFAPLVAERGKPVAEFNIEEEPASDDFNFHFPGLCGTTVPKALGIEL